MTRQENEEAQPIIDEPYSIFTKGEKWFIVSLSAFAGLFSPLTANIYFPALPLLSREFGKSTELMNLTVTMYMILQGIAPMAWGPVSDRLGRRPATGGCLLILSLSCVGLALVPTSDYWLLMVLRCLQAAGSASTIAIGAGIIGDISTREERGGFFGIFTLGPMVGPAIGPVIGGALAQGLGWRSIFWFLCISSSVCLMILILLMPETLRSLVGNGSIRPPLLYRPIIPLIGDHTVSKSQKKDVQKKSDINPFILFTYPDILLLLAITAISCAVFYGVLASVSTLFDQAYPFLGETKIGLCFMAMGGGMIIGSSINGKILDADYRRLKRQQEKHIGNVNSESDNVSAAPTKETMDHQFHIENARLRLLPAFVMVMTVCCAGFGWSIQRKVNIAVPLILQVIMGYVSITLMNSTSTLMIDLVPRRGSSVTGCNNLVRCLLSAVLVSVINLIMNGIGIGWTYVLLAGLSLTAIPLIYLEINRGPTFRERRRKAALEYKGTSVPSAGSEKDNKN